MTIHYVMIPLISQHFDTAKLEYFIKNTYQGTLKSVLNRILHKLSTVGKIQ